jgi:L-lactate dehydrogenase complex protein LldF
MLVHLRAKAVQENGLGAERAVMSTMAFALGSPRRFAWAQRLSRVGRVLGRSRDRLGWLPPPLSGWTAARDAPRPPRQSLRGWWRRR